MSEHQAKRRRIGVADATFSSDGLEGNTDSPEGLVTETMAESVLAQLVGRVHRVRAKDFIVYKAMELILSSEFNMIVGPNGTGKSSVVAAIYLGLGGSPSRFGSRKLHEYVRQGKSRAEIEIELQDTPYNTTITYSFKGPDGASSGGRHSSGTWKMNDKSVSYDKVIKKVSSLGIFVNNLCQFLPQERVAEFARESPQERLRSTMRAIDVSLIDTHDELITLGKELSTMDTNMSSTHRELEQLERRCQDRQVVIDQITEREETTEKKAIIEHAIKKHKLISLDVQIQEAKQSISKTREEMKRLAEMNKELNARLQETEQESGQFKAEVDRLVEEKKTLQNSIEQHATRLDTLSQSTLDLLQDLERSSSKCDKQAADLQALVKKVSERKKRVESMKAMDDENKVQELRQQYDELSQDAAAVQDRITQVDDEVFERKRSLDNVKTSLQKKEADLKKLQSQSQARERNISRLRNGSDILQACKLVRENRHLFDNTVQLPPLISVNLTDSELASHIGASVGQDTMSTFLCKTRKDYETFADLTAKNGINVNVKEFSRARERSVDDFRRPLSSDELSRAKIDGYIIDLVDGPNDVLCMLCHDAKLHEKMYCKSNMDSNSIKQLFESKGMTGQCTDGKTLRIVRRSRFGSRQLYTMDSVVTTPMWFAVFTAGVNKQEVAQCRAAIASLEDEIRQHSERVELLQSKIHDIKEELRPIEEERASLRAELKELTQVKKKIAGLEEAIKTGENEIESITQDRASTLAELEELKSGVRNATKTDSECLKQMEELCAALASNYDAELKVQFGLACLQNEIQLYQIVRERGGKHLELQLARLQEGLKLMSARKKELQLHIKSIEKEEAMSEAFIAKTVEKAEIHTLEELDQMRAELRAILDRDVGLHQKEHLLKLQREEGDKIKNLRQRIDQTEGAKSEKETRLQLLLDTWKPKVESFVHQISESFSKLFVKAGSAGKVELVQQGNDFDNWAIDIKVKFRDEDSNLSSLTGHRQSGGERAITTMLYLISLQNFSSSPFRIVDEINQGMDKTFERLVHKLLVEASSVKGACQYVLVTPKLLPNLIYADTVSVHCIFAGPYIGASKHGASSFTNVMIERLQNN